jgi:hypothetical protein
MSVLTYSQVPANFMSSSRFAFHVLPFIPSTMARTAPASTIGLGIGMETLQARNICDYASDSNRILVVVQLNYQSDSALRCLDEQNQSLPFVGTLVDVNAASRSALIAGELQLMCDKGTVSYVFSAPRDTKTIVVGSYGKCDIDNAVATLPAIRAEDLKIRQMIIESERIRPQAVSYQQARALKIIK